jgi:radical SAM protein with 4Fe4S-binding SPASM domain
MSSEVIGDLKRQSLMEIWQDPRFDIYSHREDRSDHCVVCDFRAYCGGCRARSLSYLDDVRAGDPGCVYNQHAWDEVLASVQKPNELVVLGQHDRVDSFLAGASDGSLTTQNVDRLVRAITDSIDPSRGV